MPTEGNNATKGRNVSLGGKRNRKKRRTQPRPRRGFRVMGRYPFKAWAGEYMEQTKGHYSLVTVTGRRSALRTIESRFEQCRAQDRTLKADPANWGEREIMVVLDDMRQRELSNATMVQYLSVLEGMLQFAGNAAMGRLRISKRHKFPKADTVRKGSLSPSDLKAVLDAAKGVEGYKGVCVSFCLGMYAYTGVRRNELLAAHTEDLNVRDWTFKVRHPKGERTYGDKRVLPIPEPMCPLATAYLAARCVELVRRGVEAATPLVFSVRDATVPLSAGTVDTWVRNLNQTPGVPRFTPHALRRTYGQSLIDKGVGLQTVSLMLGHASTNTTERYYCRKNMDDARSEVLEAMRSPPTPTESIPSRLTPEIDLPGYA